MKKYIKIIGFLIFTFFLLIISYIGTALLLPRIDVEYETSTSKDVTVYLITNGVHADIVLPIKNEHIDWSEEVKFENTTSKDTQYEYVAFGWGDKGFYLETPTWADLKFSTAFKAAFRLGTSAIHATFYKSLVENKNCKKIEISSEQYERLVKYIRNSFLKDSDGQIIYIKTNANYGTNDAFYEATGKYSLFYTCNTWANNALKSCGQKAAFWTPSDKGIFHHYSDR